MNLEDELKSKGWYLSVKGINKCKDGQDKISASAVIEKALDMDLREIGGNFLNEDGPKGVVDSISGPCVLQIQRVRNASAPKYEYCAGAPPILRLLLTDGNTNLNCLQWGQWKSVSMDTPAGTKIFLKPGKIPIQNNFLLLSERQFSVLGGCVTTLVEKWELKRHLASHVRSKEHREGGPPIWVPFGKPIVTGSAKAAGGNFRSLDQDCKEAKENEVFKQQRQANIEEIAKAKEGKTKVFGGGKDMSTGKSENGHLNKKAESSYPYNKTENSNPYNKTENSNPYNKTENSNPYNKTENSFAYNKGENSHSYNKSEHSHSFNRSENRHSFNRGENSYSHNKSEDTHSYYKNDNSYSHNRSENANSYHKNYGNSSSFNDKYRKQDADAPSKPYHKSRGYDENPRFARNNTVQKDNSTTQKDNSPNESYYKNQKNFPDFKSNYNPIQQQSETSQASYPQRTAERKPYKSQEDNTSRVHSNTNQSQNYNSYNNGCNARNEDVDNLSSGTAQMRLQMPRGTPRQSAVSVQSFLKPGAEVKAKYWEDNRYYPAIIHAVGEDGTTCVVCFTEYGNYEEVLVKDVQEIAAGWNIGPISFQPSHYRNSEHHSSENFSGTGEFRREPNQQYGQHFYPDNRWKPPRRDSRPPAKLYQPPRQRQPS